ncbi:MAG: hypothetical protein C0601_00190 [Candidatus Muiribacterium halophilum]|uniref:Ferrous iron transporter FeoA-like domain-containing protein n=1 Tax=Muiribacterium halophilum TaxID=2053465 RepID=A0A2N5ZN45_MUIH1|nr:MAG: hypothetical protein C0601_00190 [Candidatus Muirbacterium halophilum]
MSLIPLSVIPPGQKVEIVELHGGYKFKKKLADQGIFVGTTLKVSIGGENGFVKIKMDNTSFGIGIGMAHKIFVSLLEKQN